MKYPIPTFLRPAKECPIKEYTIPTDLCIEAMQSKAHAGQAVAVIRAEAYTECLQDIVEALKTCNSFALVSIEPAVRKIQAKAKQYCKEAHQ